MSSDVSTLLNRELAEFRKFVILLTSEQQSLLDNDTDTLLTLSEEKTQLINKLLEMGNVRRKTLLSGTSDHMDAWISNHAPEQQSLWSDIRKLAEQAQLLNTTNGELIQSRMRHNQQALGVLYSSSKNAAGLYGPDGQANLSNAGRHLGSG